MLFYDYKPNKVFFFILVNFLEFQYTHRDKKSVQIKNKIKSTENRIEKIRRWYDDDIDNIHKSLPRIRNEISNLYNTWVRQAHFFPFDGSLNHKQFLRTKCSKKSFFFCVLSCSKKLFNLHQRLKFCNRHQVLVWEKMAPSLHSNIVN